MYILSQSMNKGSTSIAFSSGYSQMYTCAFVERVDDPFMQQSPSCACQLHSECSRPASLPRMPG